MPVYNSQRYLRECIASVLDQTLKEIQIICVDDGSTDDSLAILEEYSMVYSNLQILHTEHIGAANARNTGLKYAKADYVIFLDSDDLFENDMLEEMFNSAVAYDADVVVCQYDRNISTPSTGYLDYVLSSYMRRYGQQTFTLRELPLEGLLLLDNSPWDRLCKKSLLIDNGILFQDLKGANDVYYAHMAVICANRIIHTHSFKPMIHYRRINNESQISNRRKVSDIYEAYKAVYLKLVEIGRIEELYEKYFMVAFGMIVQGLSGAQGNDAENKKFYDFFVKSGMKNIGLEQGIEHEGLGVYRQYPYYFKSYSYESKWYTKKILIGLQLEQKGMSEMEFLCKQNQVVIWGAGTQGIVIVEVLQEHGIRLAGIVDNSLAKQGMFVCGYEVKAFQQVCEEMDIAVISSKVYFESICESIRRCGMEKVKILPLFAYVESELALEDCIFTIDEMR